MRLQKHHCFVGCSSYLTRLLVQRRSRVDRPGSVSEGVLWGSGLLFLSSLFFVSVFVLFSSCVVLFLSYVVGLLWCLVLVLFLSCVVASYLVLACVVWSIENLALSLFCSVLHVPCLDLRLLTLDIVSIVFVLSMILSLFLVWIRCSFFCTCKSSRLGLGLGMGLYTGCE